MFPRFTWISSLQIQSGKSVYASDLREITIMFSLTSLALRHIAGKQDGNSVKPRTGQFTNPIVGMIGTGRAQDFSAGSHALAKLFGKTSQRCFCNAESSQAVPGEGNGYPARIGRGGAYRLSSAYL